MVRKKLYLWLEKKTFSLRDFLWGSTVNSGSLLQEWKLYEKIIWELLVDFSRPRIGSKRTTQRLYNRNIMPVGYSLEGNAKWLPYRAKVQEVSPDKVMF